MNFATMLGQAAAHLVVSTKNVVSTIKETTPVVYGNVKTKIQEQGTQFKDGYYTVLSTKE